MPDFGLQFISKSLSGLQRSQVKLHKTALPPSQLLLFSNHFDSFQGGLFISASQYHLASMKRQGFRCLQPDPGIRPGDNSQLPRQILSMQHLQCCRTGIESLSNISDVLCLLLNRESQTWIGVGALVRRFVVEKDLVRAFFCASFPTDW